MFLDTDWPNVRQAVKYDLWTKQGQQEGGRQHHDIASNQYLDDLPKELERLKKRGSGCFDANFYRSTAPYEFKGRSDAGMWEHFVAFGFREGRPFRMVC